MPCRTSQPSLSISTPTMPLSSPISPSFFLRPPARLVRRSGANFRRVATRSHRHSTPTRLLGCRGTLGHEATVKIWGPIACWAGEKRGYNASAERGGDGCVLCQVLAEILGEDGFEDDQPSRIFQRVFGSGHGEMTRRGPSGGILGLIPRMRVFQLGRARSF
ncbi:hypothetical protein VTK73DRAFT_9876 [Phialemonium thermophilum]|uniref:Uncharacterized protein n=1 Tax=Phialemonium thermophilum TaxID=223376 RepID=A0ABR3VZT0_9PEZI